MLISDALRKLVDETLERALAECGWELPDGVRRHAAQKITTAVIRSIRANVTSHPPLPRGSSGTGGGL